MLSASFKYFCVYYFICKHTAKEIRHKCLLRTAQKYSTKISVLNKVKFCTNFAY